MKLSLTATVLFLAAVSSALPYNGGKRETKASWLVDIDPRTAQISSVQKRQVPVEQPAMAVAGNIVPYANPGGANKRAAKIKREADELQHLQRRQVPVEQPSMAVAGNIVPYSNP